MLLDKEKFSLIMALVMCMYIGHSVINVMALSDATGMKVSVDQ